VKHWNEKIFRKNDIRGVYKKDFDLNFVKNLSLAFMIFCSRSKKKRTGKIAIGHDARLSSPEIATVLANSLSNLGLKVKYLGLVPSPLCLFATYFFKDIYASIMVTASHNPKEFNGFKISLDKKNVCDKDLLTLKKIIKQNLNTKKVKTHIIKKNFNTKRASQKTEVKSSVTTKTTNFKKIIKSDISLAYISFYKENFSDLNLYKKAKKKWSIALDFGNGASGPLAKKMFEHLKLPIKIHWLYTKPDGNFPHHHPDPSEEKNLQALKTTVKNKNCDFGAAFDGDGDRLVIVGKTGRTFFGDELMSIFISDILKTDKNPFIIADVKCADWFFDFLKKKKVRYKMWKSGHSLIREKTLKKEAIFGGELAGHFFFGGYPIDDGIYALMRLLRICFKTKKKPEELLVKPLTLETPEIRIPTDILKAKKKLILFKNHCKKNNSKKNNISSSFVDGVRLSIPKKAWGLARLSNTQNEWTFRFGGKTKNHLTDIKSFFYKHLL